MVREISYVTDGDLRHMPSDAMMNPNMPGGMPGGMPPPRSGFNNDHSIIVLNNARPHKKKSHDTIVDHSQFTIKFSRGRMDIENAPSPTPTFIHHPKRYDEKDELRY